MVEHFGREHTESVDQKDFRFYDYSSKIEDLQQMAGGVQVRFTNGERVLLPETTLGRDGSVIWEGSKYRKADLVKMKRYSSDNSLVRLRHDEGRTEQ